MLMKIYNILHWSRVINFNRKQKVEKRIIYAGIYFNKRESQLPIINNR